MNEYLEIDEWEIIERGFNPDRQRSSESIFSLGNGHMGQRANFEEHYSGDSLQGSYIAGIYYPDKTKVGWWKNGYPEYFAKVLNSINWIGIDIYVNGEQLDLAECEVKDFQRTLNMKEGYLKRCFVARLQNGNEVSVQARRFVSMKRPEAGAIEYKMKALNFDGDIIFEPYLDGNVRNEDANYNETFWAEVAQQSFPDGGLVTTKTKKLDFHVCAGMKCVVQKNNHPVDISSQASVSAMRVVQKYEVSVNQNDEILFHKYAGVASSLNHERKRLHLLVKELTGEISEFGFNKLMKEQAECWADRWERSDIFIKGDKKAQQAIRFNIFQLYQTYTGDDARLNIGPKGFTGEKYGGVTYWDTEGYCLPFYLNTSGKEVAKNLLFYRYRHLSKAIENAEKLGF
ncbi:MAG TPA: glycoside hydrolase family 65 protein, partial [Balneolaceae bacterium]|nr:glycoside hydrolase family 65 protein [Balneolaceae bacterium]